MPMATRDSAHIGRVGRLRRRGHRRIDRADCGRVHDSLRQSQIAVGFVMTLLFSDLSSFLGTSIVRIPGPTVPSFPIPGLRDIPVLGPLFLLLVIGVCQLCAHHRRVAVFISNPRRTDPASC